MIATGMASAVAVSRQPRCTSERPTVTAAHTAHTARARPQPKSGTDHSPRVSRVGMWNNVESM